MPTPPAQAFILNYNTYHVTTTFDAQVRVWLWAHTGVRAMAFWVNLAGAGSNAAQSAWVTATARAQGQTTFTVPLVAGENYALAVISDVGGEGVYAIGQLEPV
jgi:hypothetical protein